MYFLATIIQIYTWPVGIRLFNFEVILYKFGLFVEDNEGLFFNT